MDFKHPWLPLTEDTKREMLKSIGKTSIEELFSNIPEKFRLRRDLNITESHTEIEVARRMQELAEKNNPADSGRVFLGDGLGMHYIPSATKALAGRSEFVTAYTSYQPEISQGMLQTLFEYQSLMAELLEIDVVNSSMYDMASSLAEAILMSVRVRKKRNLILVPGTMNPVHWKVVNTYTRPLGIDLKKIEYDRKTGQMDLSDLESKLNDNVAGVYIENPSYLGFIETGVDRVNELVHNANALLIAGVDIMSMGILRPPGNYGADIVIAEGQGLGSPMSYGGPLLGIFGCIDNMKLIRQLPGRLVGLTRTSDEPFKRGFVLTLSPREQHIRREKATSNICSNQALIAVTAAIDTSLLGPEGFREIGETITYKSHYAANRLNELSAVQAPSIGDAFWKEFVVSFEDGVTAQSVHEGLLKRDIHGGKLLTAEFPGLGESMLLCVTEIHTKDAIDELVYTIDQIVSSGGGK
ncbi:MAG: aminomethyl-transferring glycine dehydrogenase subunit GcvPA [Candidatus Thorarchaeota archaeon]